MKTIEELFFDLVKIPSATGKEAMTSQFIEQYLANLGFTIWHDCAGNTVGSNCGNLYAYCEVDPSFSTVVLSAHMDTVLPVGQRIKIVRDGDRVMSAGETILGADNRAGIAALLGLAGHLDMTKLKVNVLLFFPVHEEAGKMGSSLFSCKQSVKYILNIDESSHPGTFVYASLSHLGFSITIHGKAAHAAKSYSKGIHAILAASQLVTKLKLGGDKDEGWTMNIGHIIGGGSTNVIPDKVEIKGEVRAFDMVTLQKKITEIKRVTKAVAKTSGATFDLLLHDRDFVPPFNGKKQGEIVDVVERACREMGIKPRLIKSFSSSDANSFASLGYPVLSVARGGGKPHSPAEYLDLSDLSKTQTLLEHILYLC